MEPRDMVQAAIDAYHDHDLDRCMDFYAPDVVVKDADGEVLMDGAEAVRARYAKAMATHPNLHYEIPNRIALGAYVIDEERVTGYSPGGPDVVRAVLVYRSPAT
ncbi:MAG: nuclear transport factor 2 family protein [Candidatus Limnocylindria bacterium]